MDQDERRYFALKELARISGVSEVTLRRYWRDGKITGFQPGGRGSRVLFPRDALERNQAPSTASPQSPPPAPVTVAKVDQIDPAQPPCRRARAQWRKHLLGNINEKHLEI